MSKSQRRAAAAAATDDDTDVVMRRRREANNRESHGLNPTLLPDEVDWMLLMSDDKIIMDSHLSISLCCIRDYAHLLICVSFPNYVTRVYSVPTCVYM